MRGTIETTILFVSDNARYHHCTVRSSVPLWWLELPPPRISLCLLVVINICCNSFWFSNNVLLWFLSLRFVVHEESKGFKIVCLSSLETRRSSPPSGASVSSGGGTKSSSISSSFQRCSTTLVVRSRCTYCFGDCWFRVERFEVFWRRKKDAQTLEKRCHWIYLQEVNPIFCLWTCERRIYFGKVNPTYVNLIICFAHFWAYFALLERHLVALIFPVTHVCQTKSIRRWDHRCLSLSVPRWANSSALRTQRPQ